MPFGVGDSPLVTLMLVSVFVLVILSHGYIVAIRDWIRAKVSE